jgi:hypothetical protein
MTEADKVSVCSLIVVYRGTFTEVKQALLTIINLKSCLKEIQVENNCRHAVTTYGILEPDEAGLKSLTRGHFLLLMW